MAIEIERKFLVHRDLLPSLNYGQEMIQGYLSVEPHIRFRIQEQGVILTVKRLQEDGSRFELETVKSQVSLEEQNQLIQMALFPVVVKIRYRFAYAGLVWEIDVYQGANSGLITADVELPSFKYPLNFPDWINSQEEITEDSRYFNMNLGRKPFTQWGVSNT